MAANGHGIIVNASTYLPWIFTYNPENVSSEKKINYFTAPNIGGSHHEKFFTGFENKEISLQLVSNDFESPLGVTDTIAYFDELRNPSPGLLGIAGSFFGNENYPPPQVLFQFGDSMVPLYWDVLDVSITKSHFKSGPTTGIFGIPQRCEISIKLSLDENSVLFKASQIAKKAQTIRASVMSIKKEALYKLKGIEKSRPGINSNMRFI
ncbi:hypothetical protein [Leptospira idonii]|uniref:Uncharacterized protein n=1 Tax=Leptospira idonii TaxID=1193500 RepID=A0A4R9M4R5_9LEPT|nr:hypothetical protein [Leptospira idonii]TGN20825.1 hypothetical protein EHS15_01950 [Leptospira idonii]